MRNRKIIGMIIILAGVILIGSSIMINLQQNRLRDALMEDYKAGSLELTPSGDAKDSDVLYVLRIPSIESENPVREGIEKGVLKDSLGHDSNSTYAGQPGNCVIAGHRNYTFGKFFNRLDEVKIDDLIYLDTADETYTYKVVDIKIVAPNEDSVLNQSNSKEVLTLYTCTPLYIATHRLVIIAKRL